MSAGAPSFRSDDLHAELQAIAERELHRDPESRTLQATAAIEEAWRKVADTPGRFESRSQFLGVAARAMRRVLVDHARRCGVALVMSAGEAAAGSPADVLELDAALTRLELSDARLARLVELRVFAGLSLDEAAGALAVPRPEIGDSWRRAQIWLARELVR
jgi:RNA polymerase sigma factor (TIGR02999 family)